MGSYLSADGRNSLPLSSGNNRKQKGLLKRRDEHLRRIPGRNFLNGATESASIQQGKKGTNQDAVIVWENVGSRTNTVFCGVFDGHDPLGHMVAKRVGDSLPVKLSAHWKVNISREDVQKENITAMGSMNSSMGSLNLAMGSFTKQL